MPFLTVEKPIWFLKMGCRALLALMVLHRAKLLASNQSVLALGRSPRTGRQPFVSLRRAVTLYGWLQASLLGLGGSPSNIAPSHGEGVWGFGKDAEIERPKALQDAKPTKRSYRDREFALFFIKTDFFYKLQNRQVLISAFLLRQNKMLKILRLLDIANPARFKYITVKRSSQEKNG